MYKKKHVNDIPRYFGICYFRVIVCLYEAMCTSRGPQGNQGGATPGKFIMGLRVIRYRILLEGQYYLYFISG